MEKEKIYHIDNCQIIRVRFNQKIIHIPNNKGLKCIIKDNNTKKLAQQIKSDYRSIFKQPLKISNQSLIIEIWGHVVIEKWTYRLARKLNREKVWTLHKTIYHHCKVVDCGEKSIDNNRKIWDFLSWFYPLFYFFL